MDPVAVPSRYKAELAEHGLNIDLTLAPAAPDRVGRVIFQAQIVFGRTPEPGETVEGMRRPFRLGRPEHWMQRWAGAHPDEYQWLSECSLSRVGP